MWTKNKNGDVHSSERHTYGFTSSSIWSLDADQTNLDHEPGYDRILNLLPILEIFF
jgi:hypothetical protein